MDRKNSNLIVQGKFTFPQLVSAIEKAHRRFAAQANKAVNVSLTLRNWMIGFYIREYEQNGADRAKYGQELLAKLSQQLKKSGALEYHFRELGRCRSFYETYPQIRRTLPPQLEIPPQKLVTHLSFSHFAEYALAGMNNKLFVSKYQVELPKKREIEKFLEATLKAIE